MEMYSFLNKFNYVVIMSSVILWNVLNAYFKDTVMDYIQIICWLHCDLKKDVLIANCNMTSVVNKQMDSNITTLYFWY